MSLPDYITSLINNIARSEEFIDYRIGLGNETKRGENFTGKVIFFQISGTRNKDGNVSLDTKYLVLKTAPSNPHRREVFQVIPGFECEVEMYTKVLPMLTQFQEEKNLLLVDKFLALPKIYATICDKQKDQFVMIMEDLRIKNYKIFPKLECTTYDHAKLVMTELAKYHALSFAFKDQKPDIFEDILSKDVLSSRFMKDDLGYEILNIFDRSIDALENEKHKQLVRDLKVTYEEWVKNFADNKFIGESGVILHGDCWSNNVIFQYDTNKEFQKPLQLMFLDWQMSRYGPPIIDLSYFLLSTTDKSFRDTYFKDLLSQYHAALIATIEKLGSDPEKLYPLSKFESDLSKFNRFPLIFALVSVLFRVVDGKNISDLDEYADLICKGERPKLILDLDDVTQTLYKNLLNDAVTDVVHYFNVM